MLFLAWNIVSVKNNERIVRWLATAVEPDFQKSEQLSMKENSKENVGKSKCCLRGFIGRLLWELNSYVLMISQKLGGNFLFVTNHVADKESMFLSR